MVPDDPLELENRRRLYDLVCRNPGLHLRELQRQLDWVMGQLEYHLDQLKQAGLVTAEKDRQFKRWFPAQLGRADRKVLAPLRQAGPRRVALQLLAAPATPSELAEVLKVAPSTLTAHLQALTRADIATVEQEGRVRTYFLVDPELVLRILVAYRPSFLDRMVDRFLDTWLEAHR